MGFSFGERQEQDYKPKSRKRYASEKRRRRALTHFQSLRYPVRPGGAGLILGWGEELVPFSNGDAELGK